MRIGGYGWATASVMLGLVCGAPRARAAVSDSSSASAAVEKFHAALATGDSAGALELFAPDAIILESGDEETRAAYAAGHLREDIAFARTVKTVRGPAKVVVVGDVAWVSSTSTSRGEFNGHPINSAGAELMVLTRRKRGKSGGGEWRIRAIHWSSHRRAS